MSELVDYSVIKCLNERNIIARKGGEGKRGCKEERVIKEREHYDGGVIHFVTRIMAIT